ncbi:hypothetical protein C8J57DRAFT_1337226 [Mycena rebaudengoi]|nr:hypothetical protein C8J57DRAFT_1337226 [Mycena rebaudengoi]
MADSHLYSRLLLPKGHGYPLFCPQPSDDLPEEYRRAGASIGDVGVVTGDGYFDYIFNICAPENSEMNWLGVPDSFRPIQLRTGAIFHARKHHRPGCDISNKTIKKRRLDVELAAEDNVFVPVGAGAVVEVAASSQEISMLLLPLGASRRNLRSLKEFEDYALNNAHHWYSFVNGKLRRKVENGSLYLVTGVDKTTSWSVAALENRSGDHTISFQLKAGLVGAAGVTCAWAWDTHNSDSFRSGPDIAPGEEDWSDNQTVFLRGYKISVRPKPLAALLGAVKVSNLDNLKPTDILRSRRSNFVPYSQSSSLDHAGRAGGVAESEGVSDTEVVTEVEDIPTAAAYHPSTVLNSYLLDLPGDADVVITHDDVWISVLNSNETGIPDDEELLNRVQAKYTAGTKHGGIYLNLDCEKAPVGLSFRRIMTRALELAREAVQIDSTNQDPAAAVQKYGTSVALLAQFLLHLRRGGETASYPGRKRRNWSLVTQEEEIRRIQSIHDTYSDRLKVLSLIYNLPPVTYSIAAEYSAMQGADKPSVVTGPRSSSTKDSAKVLRPSEDLENQEEETLDLSAFPVVGQPLAQPIVIERKDEMLGV